MGGINFEYSTKLVKELKKKLFFPDTVHKLHSFYNVSFNKILYNNKIIISPKT